MIATARFKDAAWLSLAIVVTSCDGRVPPLTFPDASVMPEDAAIACGEFAMVASPRAEPPWSGTVFVDPDLLTEADPSAFTALTYNGLGQRQMFDRRTDSFSMVNAHLFAAQFGTTTMVEIQVNPEFTEAEAEVEANFYAAAVGRLPGFLFRDIDTLWIHRGDFLFGGGNRNILIHTGRTPEYVSGGFLEEVLLHEATHTSLDSYHTMESLWQAAQSADGSFMSTYARDNPVREDLAETLGLYLAQRYWSDRLPGTTVSLIRNTFPNRMHYLDCLELTIAPPP